MLILLLYYGETFVVAPFSVAKVVNYVISRNTYICVF